MFKRVVKIRDLITRLYQRVISEKGLIDTGTLHDSIKVRIKLVKGGYNINVTAVTYIKYLEERYSITKDVFASQEYQDYKKELIAISKDIIK